METFKSKEVLELRCEKEECKYELAERVERIIVPPNILLVHLSLNIVASEEIQVRGQPPPKAIQQRAVPFFPNFTWFKLGV